MLEGIRNGQSLGALLGYQFERGLHDDFAAVEVDQFIYPLRKAFPLAADAIASTKTPNVPVEAIEARNVINGLKLVTQIRTSGQNSYPFDADNTPGTMLPKILFREPVSFRFPKSRLMSYRALVAQFLDCP